MGRQLPTAGGDARLGGGLGLGAVAKGEKLEKPSAARTRTVAGGALPRGGGHGLGSGGLEKPAAPKTATKAGGALPRRGGVGLGAVAGDKGDREKGEKPDREAVTPDASHYADPGYQADGKKRYPLDTEAHVRAALAYFAKPANFGRYSQAEQQLIRSKIDGAAKRLGIDRYENAMRK